MLLLFVAVPRSQADDRAKCQQRIERAEARLNDAMRKHGWQSRQANDRRRDLEAVYLYPGGGRWQPNVTLKTSYAGRIYARDIFLEDGRFAERLALLFKRHVGQTVAELGDLEI